MCTCVWRREREGERGRVAKGESREEGGGEQGRGRKRAGEREGEWQRRRKGESRRDGVRNAVWFSDSCCSQKQ